MSQPGPQVTAPAAGALRPEAVTGLRGVFRRGGDRLSHQFARYVLVGGVAFIIDFGCLYALTGLAGMHYLVAAAIAFTAGLLTNYCLSRVWVFSRRTIDNGAVEFAIFAAIGLVGLGLNEGILWFFEEIVGIDYLAGKFVSAAVVLFWNFGARKAILFR